MNFSVSMSQSISSQQTKVTFMVFVVTEETFWGSIPQNPLLVLLLVSESPEVIPARWNLRWTSGALR